MRVRALDEYGDFTFGKGTNNYMTEDNAIAQNIRCRLLSWEGDCFWNLQDGIDWRNLLDKGTQSALELAIKSNILQAWGVARVTHVSSVIDANRKISISYNVETINGTAIQSTINTGEII